MSHYTQLTREERYQIYALNAAGQNQTQIAQIVGRHKSSVSRELRRNRGQRGYRPRQANDFARQRRAAKAKPRISADAWSRVQRLIREDWSPEQTSHWLRSQEHIHVSHEWIYRYILRDKRQGGDLHCHLRCQKPRKKRYGAPDRRGQIKGRVSIDERPSVVEERSRIGDWEADTVVGKRGGAALVTLVERKSRLSVFAKVPSQSAQSVQEAITRQLEPFAPEVHTVTYDNGKEFAHHQRIAEILNATGYFAHPYHSWERGLNENTNGLIRQYFPKGQDLCGVTETQVRDVMEKLNNRPRKCLGFKTPNQVFFGVNPPVALAN